MAFANLFSGLSSLGEDVRRCGPAAPAMTPRRNGTECGPRGRKRKAQAEQRHPHKKVRCGAQTMENFESEHSSFALSKEMIQGNRDQADHNNWCQKGPNYKSKNNRNVNKQQQRNQHQQQHGGRPGCRGGSHQTKPAWRKGNRNKNQKQDLQVKRTRFMSQEFKDQNALLVDGRLLCRHFIRGRCIKGDGCQLEHIQGYNDLVKEICKFYVQGLCTKGSSCPYMHKSFPCKFFHRKGKCSQGADCRFSHEPLNDVTSQLLDEALKRDSDLYELAKKAEQEPSGEPAAAEEAEAADTNSPDILLQPVRPSFYKSTDTNAEEEDVSCQTDKLSDSVEEAVTPQASGAVQPHSPPSSNPYRDEPVCYSVEAVLGPQLSRPFPNFHTTPRSQESPPLSSTNCTPVPYSFQDVLRSSTFGYTPTPPAAQTESHWPTTQLEEMTDPLRPETPKETVYLVNARNEVKKPQEKMFKSLSSLHVHAGLISKTRPNLALTSGDHMKQDGNLPESEKPVQRASKHPSQLKPHLSVLTCDSRASSKPICATSGFTEFKGKAAFPAEPVTSSLKLSDSANLVSCHFETKQPTEIHLHSRKTQPGLKLGTKQHSDATTAGCSCKTASCGGLAVGCKETVKRPFHSLFSSPITDTLQHIDDSETGSSIPQSARPPPPSADCTSNHLKDALEPDRSSARSFLSLFAAPLVAAPLGAAPLGAAPLGAAPLCAAPLGAAPLGAAPLGAAPHGAAPLGAAPHGAAPHGAAPLGAAPLGAAPLGAAPHGAAPLGAAPLGAAPLGAAPLGAAPLGAAPLPCMQSSQPCYSRTSPCSQQSVPLGDIASHLSDGKQRASNLETSIPQQVRSDVQEISTEPRFLNSSPNPKMDDKNRSAGRRKPCPKQLLNPVCSLSESESLSEMSAGPPRTCSSQQQPHMSSHKGPASADSVLKGLFVCLRPYQGDGEQEDAVQISVPSVSESEKTDRGSLGSVSVTPQQKSGKKRRPKKKLKTQESHKQSTEEAAADSAQHQLSLQAPHISLETPGRFTLSRSGMTESQVRDSGAHDSPFKPALPTHHARPRPKHTPEDRELMNGGNVADTPFKELFKTLDTTVFPPGC